MKSPLVEIIERELDCCGLRGAILLKESYDPKSFGNAEVLYEIGNLQLRCVRDRGQDSVDIVVPGSGETFIFEDLSVAMGWQQLNEIVDPNAQIDFDEPPPGPIPINKVLKYIREGWSELQDAFSKNRIDSTLKKLRDVQVRRTKAMFG